MIEPGTLLQNRYRVAEQIGSGGMGAVYVATDERFGSKVAIKQTFFSDDATLRKAFEREAHLLNRLRHNALPKVSDHFVEDAGQFLVMEYIEGADLGVLLKERGGWFPVSDVLAWADELLDALDYLHTQQPPVVHRDIKPQNIKRTACGRIVLLDFGLAKGTPAQTQATVTSSVLGYSLHYAPLEQVQGAGTDPRSDLYSLGATLYHLLTGHPPVDALTRASALINNQPDPLRPAHLVCQHVTASVGKVVQRAMAQKASLRPRSASEMREMLRQAYSAEAETRASASLAQKRPASVEETVVESPARVTDRMKSLPYGETTLSARGDLRHSTLTRVAPYAPPEESPARRLSPKLLVAAAVLVVCSVIAFPLMRRSHKPVNKPETQTDATQPASAQDEAPTARQAESAGQTTSAAAAQPSPEQSQASASPSDSANPTASPADAAVAANNGANNAANNAGAAQAGNNAPAASPSPENRPPVVIQMVVPAQQPSQSAAPTPAPQGGTGGPPASDADRQAEERRRAEMDRQGPPPGGPPPPPPMGGGPPPNGGPPPQFRRPPPMR
jgi:serine/threonine protein kinase